MPIPLASNSHLHSGNKSRKDWRVDCRLRAQQISSQTKSLYAKEVGTKLEQLVTQSSVKSLAVYWPIHDELNLLPQWDRWHKQGLQLALPRVIAKSEALEFNQWQSEDRLAINQWGIAEIEAPVCALPLQSIDMIVMPCVGYWPSGYRLGYGGGFFDRTLAQWRSLPLSQGSARVAVGVAYAECELPESLSLLSTDQRCDVIVTPGGLVYSAGIGASTTRE
jgi:5-formyltetrahydrofolate cyclo-ligase